MQVSNIALIVLLVLQAMYCVCYTNLFINKQTRKHLQVANRWYNFEFFGISLTRQFKYNTIKEQHSNDTSQKLRCKDYLFLGTKIVIDIIVVAILIWTLVNNMRETDEKQSFTFQSPTFNCSALLQFAIAAILHEFGHILAAWLTGCQIQAFAILISIVPRLGIRLDSQVKPYNRRAIAFAGPMVNFLLTIIVVIGTWALYFIVRSKSIEGITILNDTHNFQVGDVLQQINGHNIRVPAQLQYQTRLMRYHFLSQRYMIDEQHSIDTELSKKQLDTQSERAWGHHFGGLKLKVENGYLQPQSADVAGFCTLSGLHYVDGSGSDQYVIVVRPMGLSDAAVSQLSDSVDFCTISNKNHECVYPAIQNSNSFGVEDLNFYVSAVVNGVERVLVTSLAELEGLRVQQAFTNKSGYVAYNNAVSWLVQLAQISIAMGLLSLGAVPEFSDGNVIVQTLPTQKARLVLTAFTTVMQSVQAALMIANVGVGFWARLAVRTQ